MQSWVWGVLKAKGLSEISKRVSGGERRPKGTLALEQGQQRRPRKWPMEKEKQDEGHPWGPKRKPFQEQRAVSCDCR